LVGQTLTLDGKAYTVVGILPPRLKYPGLRLTLPSSGADVWIPLVPAPAEQNRNFANIRAVARLKQGITIAQAQAEMNVLALQLEQQYPDSNTNVAAGVFRLPITGFATAIFTVQGQPVPVGQEPNADYRTISHDYFRTMKMTLTEGRGFTERDNEEAPDAVIINEELARRFFPNEDPVGKRLQVAMEKTRWREIVGVVANAKLSGLEAKTDPAIYVPFRQNTWPNALRTSFLVVRTDGDPNNYHAAIRQALRSIDPALPITQLRTMDEIIADSLSQRRFNTALLLVFAIVAALLAAVGVYGVMSYLVTQRAHELGVRMALGAQRGDILKLVAGGGAKLAAIGIAVGVTLAMAMTRLMSGLLFGVGATDPWTFVLIALLFAAVAMLASYLPARRAARTDPLTALRYD
jgi:putative ABC transport system permease protein